MADSGVSISSRFVEWLRTGSDSPVIKALDEAAAELLAIAVPLAPVSRTGSRHAPPGFLRSRVQKSRPWHDDADGGLRVGVGVPLRNATRYPLDFVDNRAGVTFNRGHRTARRADDDFLGRAVDLMPTSRVW